MAQLGMAADRRRYLQHLAHAGAALGAFVANHQHIARLDLARLHGGKAVFFAVEDARRSAMLEAIGSGNLHHAAFRREIALENDEAAGRLDGLVEGLNDDLSRRLLRPAPLLRQASCR